MAKVPLAGTVKTRLEMILTPEKCAALAAAFLEDALRKAKNVCPNVILAYAGKRELLEAMISPEIIMLEQTGADLGEKMERALRFALMAHSPVVMIGTDSPTFPARYLREAVEALERNAEIVLGKSADGGFYLIGLRETIPNLFDSIEWSTPQVFGQITRNVENLGMKGLYLLPAHYDVDTPADFLMLKNEIFADQDARKAAPETSRWLVTHSFVSLPENKS